MKRFEFLALSLLSILKREKINGILAVILLVVSTLCSLFLLSYGYDSAKKSQQNKLEARMWCLDVSLTGEIADFSKELQEKYDILSGLVIGKCRLPKYTAQGEGYEDALVGTEIADKSSFMTTFGVNKFKSVDEVLIGGSGSFPDGKININGTDFNVIGDGFYSYAHGSPFFENPKFYVSPESYTFHGFETVGLCIVFRDAVTEEQYEEFFSLISNFFEIGEIHIPEYDADKEQIEELRLCAAAFVICLSFVNVFAVFSYILEKNKTDFRVIRLCGGTKKYVLLMAVFLLFALVLFSFAVSCGLYLLLTVLLKNTSFYYPLSPYVAFVGFALDILPALVCVAGVKRGDRI